MALMEIRCLLIYVLLNYKIELAYEPVIWTFKFVYTI